MRSLLLGGIALGAVATLGVAYSKLTVAGASPAAARDTLVAPTPPATPAVASALPTPSVEAAPSALAPSPETQRLEERRVLYETVDALVQASEFERARQLLDQDQERYGDDSAPEWRDLEQGYRLMADCLERPSAKHRARGEAFLLVSEAHAISAKLRAACNKPTK
jgi:hypothetical protein